MRDLISIDDVMEDEGLRFGPNGGLIYCMEYLAQNFDWLQEQLDEEEDDYIIFDCPGEITIHVHFELKHTCLCVSVFLHKDLCVNISIIYTICTSIGYTNHIIAQVRLSFTLTSR